mmetsp:Transcript_26870/g.64115  ORF Transcript_26870/g.64115 Transcript_26870/m.64115 type:complete len:212 (+) Transcript_26870:634-1269(+)
MRRATRTMRTATLRRSTLSSSRARGTYTGSALCRSWLSRSLSVATTSSPFSPGRTTRRASRLRARSTRGGRTTCGSLATRGQRRAFSGSIWTRALSPQRRVWWRLAHRAGSTTRSSLLRRARCSRGAPSATGSWASGRCQKRSSRTGTATLSASRRSTRGHRVWWLPGATIRSLSTDLATSGRSGRGIAGRTDMTRNSTSRTRRCSSQSRG